MKEKSRQKLLQKLREESEIQAALQRPSIPAWDSSNLLDPKGIPSSTVTLGSGAKKELTAGRLTGEMIWSHKTAPTLQIHGRRPVMNAEEHAASRRR
jgi:hypothetical protein